MFFKNSFKKIKHQLIHLEIIWSHCRALDTQQHYFFFLISYAELNIELILALFFKDEDTLQKQATQLTS